VPCSPLAFQPHGPMPHCPPPQFWGGTLDIDCPPLAPQFYCGGILDVDPLASPPHRTPLIILLLCPKLWPTL
jgi:hypothetical protein